MKATFLMLGCDYDDVNVKFYYDKTTGDWYVEENGLRALSGLSPESFAVSMNRAEYKKTRLGHWVVSVVDAYLVLPDAPRAWMHTEQFKHLPLRLKSGSEHDAMLRSVQEQTRRYVQLASFRASATSAARARNMDSIRTRIEKNIARLDKYGVSEHNSKVIRAARRALEQRVRDADGSATV